MGWRSWPDQNETIAISRLVYDNVCKTGCPPWQTGCVAAAPMMQDTLVWHLAPLNLDLSIIQTPELPHVNGILLPTHRDIVAIW